MIQDQLPAILETDSRLCVLTRYVGETQKIRHVTRKKAQDGRIISLGLAFNGSLRSLASRRRIACLSLL